MLEERDKSRLDQTRKSVRSRVTRQSLTHRGVPLDLTPVLEEGRRRFGRVGLGVAALGGLVALLWFAFRPPSAPPRSYGEPVAALVVSRGTVGRLPAGAQGQGRLLHLEFGSPVHAGDMIETGSDPGRAALLLAGGTSLRLDTNTRVQVSSASAIVLDRGGVYLDSADALARMEVRTTLGVVRELGTQFEVRLVDQGEESLRMRVREGKVLLRHGQEDHEVGVGEELTMRGDGTLVRGTVAIYGPHWDWILDAAPIPDLEGLDLHSFLDWLSREGGWTVRFTDEEMAGTAAAIILHGDAIGLTPMEAASMVLHGSQLKVRVEEDVLVVETARAP